MAQQVKVLAANTANLSCMPGSHLGGRRDLISAGCPLTSTHMTSLPQ